MQGCALRWMGKAAAVAVAMGTAVAAAQFGPPAPKADRFEGKPRVVVISDIGNEPDDQMSMVRLVVYSNELDLEAIIASTSTWQKTLIHPETMRAIADAYAEVLPNLKKHAEGWPDAVALKSRIYAGQTAYGMAATGAEKSTEGSRALARAIEREDPRPLWVCLWGGANTLAQALIELRAKHTPEEMAHLVGNARVYSISDQDDAGPWIRREFAGLSYIVQPSGPDSGEYAYAAWTGISGDRYYRNGEGADSTTVTNEWLDAHVRKGPLGKFYPKFMFIMEGDTPSFLGLLDNGLNSYRRPDWGGWGGRYIWRKPYAETHAIWTQGGDEFLRMSAQDEVVGADGRTHVSEQATVWRWREAYQNDFAARMDWTVKDYAQANHNPLAVVNGVKGTAPIEMEVEAGKTVKLDAGASSDPDGQAIHFHWFHYQEAGAAEGNLAELTLEGAETAQVTVHAVKPCREGWLKGMMPCRGDGVAHVILAVTDEGSPRLTSYRRVILKVKQAAK